MRKSIRILTAGLFLATAFLFIFSHLRSRDLREAKVYAEDESGVVGEKELAPFVPTPMIVVERMLDLAEIKGDDVLYDLGSGDGRIVITAAKKYGIRAVGIELDPELVRRSRENAIREAVDHLVEFREEDIMKTDVSPATVVTLYLLPDSNMLLRPILWSTLRPGARVISNDFDMDDWKPERVETVLADGGDNYTIYAWRITGREASGSYR